jgi:tetratricopeptide (TPR) repeat protein
MTSPTVPPRSEDPDQALIERLRADVQLDHLASSLELADGFTLDLLVCSAPRIARAAIKALRALAATWADESTRFEVLDPYRSRSDLSRALDADDAIRAVLVPLVAEEWTGKLADGDRALGIVIVDASLAHERDEQAWRHLFRRLNESRNLIIERLHLPLLLCLPDFLEPIFAHEAPDFWSVRSLVVNLDLRLEPLATLAEGTSSVTVPDFSGEPFEFAGATLLDDLAKARKEVEASPDNEKANLVLGIQLRRFGQREQQQGRLESALAAFEEELAIQRKRLDKARDRQKGVMERSGSVANSLNQVGTAYLQLGRLDQALAAFEESAHIYRSIGAEDAEDAAELGRELELALLGLGVTAQKRGEIDRAVKALDEAARMARRLAAQDLLGSIPLAHILLALSRCYRDRGDFDRALAGLQESLDLFQRTMGDDAPETLDALAELALVHSGRRDFGEARRILEKVVGVQTRTLGPEAPRTLDANLGLAFTIANLGDFAAARTLTEQVLEIQTRTLGPDSPGTKATIKLLAELPRA